MSWIIHHFYADASLPVIVYILLEVLVGELAHEVVLLDCFRF